MSIPKSLYENTSCGANTWGIFLAFSSLLFLYPPVHKETEIDVRFFFSVGVDTIFVRVYESRMDLLRAVIIGAEGTPYHDGLFFFDIFFPSGYPSVPPVSNSPLFNALDLKFSMHNPVKYSTFFFRFSACALSLWRPSY